MAEQVDLVYSWTSKGRWRTPMEDDQWNICGCALAASALAHGTLAEGSTLHWEEGSPRVRCRSCNAIFAPEDQLYVHLK
jgi:hypothetical protein